MKHSYKNYNNQKVNLNIGVKKDINPKYFFSATKVYSILEKWMKIFFRDCQINKKIYI